MPGTEETLMCSTKGTSIACLSVEELNELKRLMLEVDA